MTGAIDRLASWSAGGFLSADPGRLTMQDITGVWLLRAFQVENLDTGEVSEPFGPDPRGTMMFHPDGRMVALLTPVGGRRLRPTRIAPGRSSSSSRVRDLIGSNRPTSS